MKRRKAPIDTPAPSPIRGRASVSEAVYFAVGQSSLGAVLVASSDLGVVAILIGDDDSPLAHDLHRRFPDAHLIDGDKVAKVRVKSVVDYIESPAHGLDLPLDIRGTEFQTRVWRAVREIPMGQTSTYKDVASKVGSPKAVRAVGNACATNNLALAVPCHRVLSSAGTISEGWGRERKRVLIEREKSASEATG